MKTLLITIILLAVAIVLLGIKVLFIPGSRFPSGHAHHIPDIGQKRRKL